MHLPILPFILLHLPSFTPITFHSSSSAFIYPHYLSFSFICLHFPILPFTLLHLSSFILITFHSSLSAFIYPHYLSFSFICLHFPILPFTLLHLSSFILITLHSPSSDFIYPRAIMALGLDYCWLRTISILGKYHTSSYLCVKEATSGLGSKCILNVQDYLD